MPTELAPTLEQAQAAAVWEQGHRCPWNGCPSICVHGLGWVSLNDDTGLLCDACDTAWTRRAAKDWLAERGEHAE